MIKKLTGALREIWPNSFHEFTNGISLPIRESKRHIMGHWGARMHIELTVAWCYVILSLRKHRKKRDHAHPIIAFWRRTDNLRAIWSFLFVAEYECTPINISKMARSLDIDRAHITKTLKEAKTLGYVTDENYLSKESHEAIINGTLDIMVLPAMQFWRLITVNYFTSLIAEVALNKIDIHKAVDIEGPHMSYPGGGERLSSLFNAHSPTNPDEIDEIFVEDGIGILPNEPTKIM